MEIPIEIILAVEDITQDDLYGVYDNCAVFDVYNKTSYSITYHEDYMVFCHNKHYYSFTTMKEFEKIFHEHWYRYYDLGERNFEIEI